MKEQVEDVMKAQKSSKDGEHRDCSQATHCHLATCLRCSDRKKMVETLKREHAARSAGDATGYRSPSCLALSRLRVRAPVRSPIVRRDAAVAEATGTGAGAAEEEEDADTEESREALAKLLLVKDDRERPLYLSAGAWFVGVRVASHVCLVLSLDHLEPCACGSAAWAASLSGSPWSCLLVGAPRAELTLDRLSGPQRRAFDRALREGQFGKMLKARLRSSAPLLPSSFTVLLAHCDLLCSWVAASPFEGC